MEKSSVAQTIDTVDLSKRLSMAEIYHVFMHSPEMTVNHVRDVYSGSS